MTTSRIGSGLGERAALASVLIVFCGSWLAPAASADADQDADGIADALDNCLRVANALQRDTDGDQYGNACDPDLDGDGAVDATDLDLLRAAFFSASPDADFNGDGIVDYLDLGRMKRHFFGVPGPSISECTVQTSAPSHSACFLPSTS